MNKIVVMGKKQVFRLSVTKKWWEKNANLDLLGPTFG